VIDEAGAAPQGYALQKIFELLREVGETRFTEGYRLKPGERGGNPSYFFDELFGPWDIMRRVRPSWTVGGDVVDGTGKASENIPNSMTALMVTGSETIGRVPDEHFIKAAAGIRMPDHIDVDTPPSEIYAAFSHLLSSRKSLNLFNLTRGRHLGPMADFLNRGFNFIQDQDGDLLPMLAIAAGLFCFEHNHAPLDGMWGEVGGASEFALGLPLYWLGGWAKARFASKSGLGMKRGEDRIEDLVLDMLKKGGNAEEIIELSNELWACRYKFSNEELGSIRAEGFDPYRSYGIEELFIDADKPGIAAYGNITPNFHFDMPGTQIGTNTASVPVLVADNTGALYALNFKFGFESREDLREKFRPISNKLLSLSEPEIGKYLADKVFNSSRSSEMWRVQFGQKYYSYFTPISGRFLLDEEVIASAVKGGALPPKDLEVIRATQKLAPEWFASEGEEVSVSRTGAARAKKIRDERPLIPTDRGQSASEPEETERSSEQVLQELDPALLPAVQK
ncbi:MAG: fructose-bisphosphatase class II, partial [Candidatus Margulisiibacteriota bacterium]